MRPKRTGNRRASINRSELLMGKKLEFDFSQLDMTDYAEAAVESAKALVQDMQDTVGLPLTEEGWIMLSPEMLVMLVLACVKGGAQKR